ncbi:Zn(II)2Cys6 transcription factor domain-containing protein [Aspergillus brunneoviolaceus CBS 621.78]|uniref:Uncharacterized protein n=1 Tax=Aspergillus brunneoviolaceus CBS 621.78 TaxID=1450534 RepID=A0ACD1G2H5_9EURO|nr:hypothetical protein BO95DRAFT_483926 [Aspergillus brunneoviolaceus CBS 621.78]RAH43431.1 hypothetical protein BO95DRAFT_483926 [Aspergillus brunneoviolaceus CBS 621.78]
MQNADQEHSAQSSSYLTNAPQVKRSYAHKACEACRAAKLKCSAQYPCQRCEQRSRPCVYRESLRRRPGAMPLPILKAISEVPCSSLNPSSSSSSSSSPSSPSILGTENGTDYAVYYWIHTLFQGFDVPSHQIRTLVFESSVSPWDLLPIMTVSIPDLQYLSPNLATRCLNIFTSSFWHLNPYYPINSLQAALCDVFGVVGSPGLSSPMDWANVLAVLAIGASCTEYYPLAEYLLNESYRYAEMQMGGNTLSMSPLSPDKQLQYTNKLTRRQHAQYYLNINQHGIAYTILTQARRGYLAGKERADTEISTDSGEGRTSTAVTLNAFAQFLSLCVGCVPDDLDQNEIFPDTTANGQLPPVLSAIHQLARITAQIKQAQKRLRLYPDALAQASFELHQSLQIALLEASNRCRLLYAAHHQQRIVLEVLIFVLFYYEIQILFRPFLMMKLLHLHRVRLRYPDETISSSIFEVAGAHTVRAARSLIRIIGQAIDLNSVVKDLPGNGFFLESACVSLILMCLCHGPRDAYLTDIWMGIHNLRRMSCQALVGERIQGLVGLLAVTGLAGAQFDQA